MQHQLPLRARRLALWALAFLGAAAPRPAHALLPPQSAQVALGNLPTRVLWAIESNDLKTLATLSHSKGVRFYPHLVEDLSQDSFKPVRLSPAQMRSLAAGSRRRFRWGTGFGSGDPIELSWPEFRRDYLWNHDFSKGKVSFNDLSPDDEIVRRFPNSIFVQSYIAGSGAMAAHNWASLTMMFGRQGKSWKLSGLAANTSNHV